MAGGDVEEEVCNRHRGADRRGDCLHLVDGPGRCFDDGAARVTGGPRDDAQAADGGDACKRLAAKAERSDAPQVVGHGELAGCVPCEGEWEVRWVDPSAVVTDSKERKAPSPDLEDDGFGAGVDGVLGQLLHGGDRPLHDLTRGDEGDDVFFELPDR